MQTRSIGKLFLVPTFLGVETPEHISPYNLRLIFSLKNFIVENEKNARRFLKQIAHPIPQADFSMVELNKHTSPSEAEQFLNPVFEGENMGLLSDCGCPAVADPGNSIVKQAHLFGIKVLPLVGASSILLTLMASGLNGQNFAFIGYLPIEKHERNKAIKNIEQTSIRLQQTQLFIETPYRNQTLFNELLQQLHRNTLLCVACNLNSENEYILTQSVGDWQKMNKPDLNKKPTVFALLGA